MIPSSRRQPGSHAVSYLAVLEELRPLVQMVTLPPVEKAPRRAKTALSVRQTNRKTA